MIGPLAWHELRQQVGGRVFWIVFAVSVLMVAGAMSIDALRVGLSDEGARTGAAAIMRTQLVWTLFFLFTAAAFVGEAALRDEANGFADLVRVTTVDPHSYALGRFVGACAALLLCFLSVPAAMAAAAVVLGLGTGPAGAYLFALFVLAAPNLLLASALFFALSAVTRSMTGCLLGAAGLLTLYGLGRDGGPGWLGVVEPFGFAALAGATRGWSAAQRDATWPALGGALLANRLLWLVVTETLVGLGAWFAGRRGRAGAARRSRVAVARAPALDDTAYLPREARPQQSRHSSWRVIAIQMGVRTAFEVRRVVMTPVFVVLLLMGLAAAASAAAHVTGTAATVAALATSFQLVPVVVALFFAGELLWAEREHNVAALVAATSARGAVLVLPKVLALALVLLLLAVASAGAGAVAELAEGRPPQLAAYLAWYIVPKAYEWLLLGVLAVFLQSLAPSKLAGWGYLVFYLIGSLALDRLGWQDPHYRYGGYPGAPLPPVLSGVHGVSWYRLGWGMVATAMVALACKRGLPGARADKAA